jgi:hypothetical protein
MSLLNLKSVSLSTRDLDFLVETASPEVTDKRRLKQIIRKDEAFRNSFIEAERVFRKVIDDDEILLKILPTLFFEILLRKAAKDLKQVGYTFERTSNRRIPVFDTKEVLELLTKQSFLGYLAEMLSSFTRIESYAFSFRARQGPWKKIRFNDLDIHSLMSFCEVVENEYRLIFYKRIADICLFILGIFPDYVERDYRYPFSRAVRPQMSGRIRNQPGGIRERRPKILYIGCQTSISQRAGIVRGISLSRLARLMEEVPEELRLPTVTSM